MVGELSWGRALQLSAIFFNVGYVLATSLRKEAGNTTLECCFSLNMDAVNVDFVRHLVVTQGKTHSQVSLSVLRLLPLNGHFLNWQLGDVSQRCPSQRENSTPTPVPIVFYLQFKMESLSGSM